MTHYSNDYFDLAADRANPTPTRWSGGSGVLPAGLLAPGIALLTAVVAGLLALVVSVWLATGYATGPLTLPLFLLAILLAWGYSAPPLRLHSSGAGEISAAVLVGGLTPLTAYYLQAGRLSLLPFLAAAPLVILQCIMLILIEFPDEVGDAAAGKKTLVVRLGPARAAHRLQELIVLQFVLLPLLAAAGLPLLVAGVVALVNAPGLLWLWRRLRQGVWARPSWWNLLGFTGVALLFGTVLVEAAAFAALFASGG